MTFGARGKRTTTAAATRARGSGRLGTALRWHEHWSAAVLFALVVLVYLWPALVGGGLLSPGSVMYGLRRGVAPRRRTSPHT